MRRCTFIIFLLIYSTACSTQHRIKFIHWNDVHAENEPFVVREGARTVRVGGFAYDKSVIDSLRSSAIKAGETPFLLDAGDEFQGTIISTLTKGRSQYELLNLLHPDAVTLGNHEFDYGWVNLQRLLSDIVRFPIVNANVFDAHGSHIASPYVIVEKDSIRIAVIGLVTSA